jgi:CubicO group peptidase (beta-lactamase class C family)
VQRRAGTGPPIGGFCDPAFAAVRQAFVENFTARGDVGAAVAISIAGRPIVDLWGGWRDAARRQPWRRETLVNVFSATKALTAICALQLVQRGLLDLDAPIARTWPQFAAAGKERISLRQVLSHRAALPAVRAPLPEEAMLDWPRMTAALAAEAPWWSPGASHGYHVNTFGFLVGETVRRAAGHSLGSWLRTHVAAPLGADVHVGLLPVEHRRVAEFLWPDALRPPAPQQFADDDQHMRWNAYWNPPGLSGAGWVNRAEWRQAELPSSGGHASARGLARVYAALAAGGTLGQVHVLSSALLAEATREHSAGPDRILERPSRFGIGFQLTQPERPLGPNPGAFGHFGTGGSVGFCDPAAGVAFAYVMNDLGPRWQNPRNRALIEALYECL